MYRKAHCRVLNHYRELATTTGACVGVNLHQSECALRWESSMWCPEGLSGTGWSSSYCPHEVICCCNMKNSNDIRNFSKQEKKKKTTHRTQRLVNHEVYRTLAFSGMFMMWSSLSSLGFWRGGEQDLNEEARVGFASIVMKLFSNVSSFLSMQSWEPGLVPYKIKIKTIFISPSLHPVCTILFLIKKATAPKDQTAWLNTHLWQWGSRCNEQYSS